MGRISCLLLWGSSVYSSYTCLCADYYQQLEQHAGGQQCKQLLWKMGILNWNGSRCRRLTVEGGALLESILDAELGGRSSVERGQSRS